MGNVVLQTAAGKVLWQTNTHGSGSQFFLWVQHDGNVVLYQGVPYSGVAVVWASNTAVAPAVCAVSAQSGAAETPSTPLAAQAKYTQFASWQTTGTDNSNNIHIAKTTNHDYFVANKAFFFDLSIWGDEAPNDDPEQPLGTDRATLLVRIH